MLDPSGSTPLMVVARPANGLGWGVPGGVEADRADEPLVDAGAQQRLRHGRAMPGRSRRTATKGPPAGAGCPRR
jgi:hypothetical protein